MRKHRSWSFFSDRLKKSLSIGLALATVGAPWPAAGLERSAAPIEADVSPTSTVMGSAIAIFGRSVQMGDRDQIRVVIRQPDGSQRELSTSLSDTQAFNLSFTETSQPGDYRVTVFAPDGKASVEKSFSIKGGPSIRRESIGRMSSAFKKIEEGTDGFSETIRKAPASVARDDLAEKMDGLKELLADVDKYLDLLDESVELLEEAVEEDKENLPSGGDGAGEPKPGTDPNLNPGDTEDKPQSVPDYKPTEPGDPQEGVGETKPGTDPNLNPGDTEDKPQSVPEGGPTPPGGEEPGSARGESPGSGSGSGGGSGSGPGGSGSGGGGGGGSSGGDSGREAREELRRLHEEMARTADEIERQQQSFEHQLQAFDYDHTLCDGLHYVQQAWDSMTAAMTAAKKVAKAAVGSITKVLKDTLTEEAVKAAAEAELGDRGGSSLPAETLRSQGASAAKAAATGSLSGFKILENGLKGLVEFDIEIFYRIFCEKYVGPFTGKMTAEVFVEAGRFYAYETSIEGELRLRYERGSTGAQPVTGEFEGVATWFKLDEDLWRIQPEVRNDVVGRLTIPPLPSVYGGSIGTFARVVVSPNYFYVPVRGVIEGDTARIRLEPARQDFDKSSTAAYILVKLGVPFPYVMTQEIQHEGGHYILTRALREDPEFEITVHREEEYSEISESFRHDAATPDNMVKVRTEVEVRACNPKCP